MKISTLVGLVNTKLAGETLTYAQCQPLFDEVITEINTHLNACFPLFSTYAPSLTDLTAEYDCFPEQYLVSVVVTGAAYKFYTIDEEGIAVAQGYGTDYQSALFFMVRDYSRQVPEKYQASGRGYISATNNGDWLHNTNDMFSMSCSAEEEGFQPAIRYVEGPRGLPGQSIVGPAGDFYKLEVHDNKVYAVRYNSAGALVEHSLKTLICDLADLKGEQGEQGPKGEQGEVGAQGPEGKPGKDGIDGKDGKDGADYDESLLLPKIELWQPNKSYKKNAWVRGLVIYDNAGQAVEVVADLFCLIDHTSPKVTYPYQDPLFKQHWKVHYNPTVAACDKIGRDFTTEYATIYDLYDYAKLEKVYDHSSETSADLIIYHNELYCFGVLTDIILHMSPDVYIDEVEEPFACSIVFKTGATPTIISQDGITITWSGDDCDSDGVFIPETNKTYEVSIKKLGLIISARVGVI